VWVSRGLVAAAVFAGLYVATGIFFGVLGRLERRPAREAPQRERHGARVESPASPGQSGNQPPYMQPGFQEEVQARRRVEEELESVEKERDSLKARLRHLESELAAVKDRSGEPEPAADVVPFARH
jgi:hypothetical protein